MGGFGLTNDLFGQELMAGDELNSAKAGGRAAVQAINDVRLPSIAKMRVKLQELVQQGVLSPEMASTFLQEASAYQAIDPRAQEAEYGALGGLQDVVDQKGMDEQSVAALRQLQEQTQLQDRGAREAILQNAAARGIEGSGIELASKMGAQQGSATSLANQGFQAAADANQRKLAALQGIGQLGGQIQSQEGEKASAQNAINQFNTANRQSLESQNVAARNAAAAQNLSEKQRVADTNIGTKNQQELYNKALYQQDFANQLARGQALSNANLGQAQSSLDVAKKKTAGIDSESAKWSDKNLKTNIKEIDPETFMDELTGYKYKYKNPEKFGEGERVGPMAQDIEKVAPQAVNDTPEGKSVSYDKMGAEILAALASLNERLHEVEDA